MPPENQPSQDRRDVAIRAALRDAVVIASILQPRGPVASDQRVTSSAPDEDRSEYLRVLGGYVADLGGRLDELEGQPVATFGDRRVFIVFSRYA